MYTTVLPNGQCVLYIVAVEADTLFRHGRGERALKDADIILIKVYVGEYILDHGIDDVARLEIVIDTR